MILASVWAPANREAAPARTTATMTPRTVNRIPVTSGMGVPGSFERLEVAAEESLELALVAEGDPLARFDVLRFPPPSVRLETVHPEPYDE